ncbi:hypothetical protein CHS0354_035467 [Potamilus streckersoni]|nr:hypothetical protein CHS0354_035467 [Potamilus streckersoni]
MGSGCQYVNIAYSTSVSSPYLNFKENVVDGRRNSCPERSQFNINIAHIAINFGQNVKVTEVQLYFPLRGDNRPFNVSVIENGTTNLCASADDTTGQKEFILKCGKPLYGQYINITSFGPDVVMEICEVQVPAGRNIAFGKPAYQRSLFETYYAYRAVDGDTILGAPWITCSHTHNQTDPWWLLDLESPAIIQWLRIYNRNDDVISKELNQRLRHFRIFLSQDNVTFNQYYQDQSTDTPLIINVVVNSEVKARYVKIDIPGELKILTLCEVQVFSDCPDFYYGRLCNTRCSNCKEDDACDKVTGHCPRGCRIGWLGPKCQEVCRDYYYGNCTTRCGHCRDSSICDKFSGLCPSNQCSEGWDGKRCDKVCDLGHYGPNCVHRCGHCLNVTCDQSTGICPEDVGCESGWQGSRCDINVPVVEQQRNAEINTGILAGAVAAAFIVGIVGGIVIVIGILQRRDNKDNRNKGMGRINRQVTSASKSTEMSFAAKPEESKTYYNEHYSMPHRDNESFEMSSSVDQERVFVIGDNSYETMQDRPN